MRLVLIAAGLAVLFGVAVLLWQSLGPGLVTAWFTFQRDVNSQVAAGMRDLKEGGSLVPLLGGMVLAFLYGAVHAIGPGHGKLVITSYFATRNARPWYGFLMAARIGTMHVVSAVVVVGFADFLLRRTFGGVPVELPAIRIVAYAVLTATGMWMLVQALRRLRPPPPSWPVNPGTSLVQAHLARTSTAPRPAPPVSPRENGWLAAAVGLVPCTGSILILSFALAHGVLWAGYLLVAAIALGMTLTMTLLGLGAIGLNRLLVGRSEGSLRAERALDLTGAALVTGFGLLLLGGALLS
ncbi:nickel/cobalt transporter [Geminicoccus roseus]|uniref:nickel/cobalt transporter n=1 Tax=Geminicoccus roseus TaxID=404900 RepID=UPI0004128C16|nr:hypothetical protein [Geminicoccus roseus]